MGNLLIEELRLMIVKKRMVKKTLEFKPLAND